MKGEIVFFDKNTNTGIIADTDENRYHFHIGEWLSDEKIKEGQEVFFKIPKREAVDIYINQKKNPIKFFLNWFR